MSWSGVAVIILIGVLGVVLKSYDSLLRELTKYKQLKEKNEARARDKAVKIVEEARDKALAILEEAKLKTEELKTEMGEKAEQVSEKQLTDYKKTLQNISNTIDEHAGKELEEFRKALETETVEAQRLVGKKLEEKYAQVNQEVEEYRLRKLEEVNKGIMELLEKMSREVVGRSLTAADHTRLVTEALEEARKANVV